MEKLKLGEKKKKKKNGKEHTSKGLSKSDATLATFAEVKRAIGNL